MAKKLKLLMLSGDRTVLRPGQLQKRLLMVAERLAELYVVVPAASHKQQINFNAWIYGSGGRGHFSQWLKVITWGNRLVKEHGVNVITAQDPFALGLAAYIIARKNNLKLHLQDHGGFAGNELFKRLSLKRRLQFSLGRWLVTKAQIIRTVSRRAAAGLIKLGVDKNRIIVAPIGTEINKYSAIAANRVYRPTVRNILAVGRLEPEKGWQVLLRALALVVSDYQDVNLTIVGEGAERASLTRLAKSLNVSEFITWAGRQSDLTEYYRAADMLVIPSYTEGWGLVAVEGAASGLPIVMTDVGCAAELLVDDDSAIIVKPGSVKLLAGGLIRLIKDGLLRHRLGQAAAAAAANQPPAEDLLDQAVNSYYQALT